MKTRVYRHGEICFIQINKLPENLVKSESKEIVKGSHSNSHCITQGDLYFKDVDQYIFGYLVAKDTKLTHLEHGNICSVCKFDGLRNTNICPKCNTDFVKDGKLRLAILPDAVYELRKQNEFINNELQPVID